MIIHTIEYISNIMHMRIHAHIRMRIQTHNKHVCAKQAFKYTNAHIHTTRIHTHTFALRTQGGP